MKSLFAVWLILILSFTAEVNGKSKSHFINAMGWQTQMKFSAADFRAESPRVTTWQINQAQEITQLEQVELEPRVFQGYATALIADKLHKQSAEQLVLFGKDGVYRVTNGEISLLIASRSLHSKIIDASVFKPFPYSVDVNGDGLTDFILPDVDRHVLWLQSAAGGFEPSDLSIDLPMSLFEDENQQHSMTLSYPLATKVTDFDSDGFSDILLAFADSIHVFKQTQTNVFSSTPVVVKTPFPLDTNMQTVQQSGRKQAFFLQQVIDVNGDNLLDLVVEKKTIESDKSESQAIEFYLGGKTEEQAEIQFKRTASIEVDGEMLSYGLSDFTGNGISDFYYVSGDIGAGSVMSAFFGSGFDVEINIHQQLEDGSLSIKPVKRVSTNFKLDVKNAIYGLLLKTIDVNKDGITDLLVEQGNSKLVAYYGQSEKPMKKRSNKISLNVPKNPNKLIVVTIRQQDYLLSLENIEDFPALNRSF